MPVNVEQVKNRIRNTVASNKNDLYNSNIYWSQKPYNICDILIESFSNKGDIVYDWTHHCNNWMALCAFILEIKA